MLRTLLIAASLTLVSASVAPAAHAADPAPSARASSAASAKATRVAQKVAQKAKKKAKPDKKAEEKPQAAPEGARVDPRTAPSAGDASAAAADPGARRGMSRIEFDDRLVQGQTNKANAIYLFERRESALRSLLKKRVDFHEEIDETLE